MNEIFIGRALSVLCVWSSGVTFGALIAPHWGVFRPFVIAFLIVLGALTLWHRHRARRRAAKGANAWSP